MERRNHRDVCLPGERQAKKIQMTVEDVEVAHGALHSAEDDNPRRDHVLVLRAVVPYGLVERRNKASRSLGISGGEQSHVVTSPYELFGQRVDHALGPAIARRRNPLEWWRKLGNSHSQRVPPSL